MNSNFMSFTVCFLNGRIVTVFVWDKECRFDITTIWIFSLSIKDIFVQLNVVVVNGIIKGNCNHHGNIFGGQIPRNCSSIFGTEAIRQDTNCGITWGSAIWIVIDVCTKKIICYFIMNEIVEVVVNEWGRKISVIYSLKNGVHFRHKLLSFPKKFVYGLDGFFFFYKVLQVYMLI